jgi:hypothetical protein
MRWTDWLWEAVDNALFLAHVLLVGVLLAAAIACPLWLHSIHTELVIIRDQMPPMGGCHCRRCDDDGPGPILPRVLPRLRNLREEGGE